MTTFNEVDYRKLLDTIDVKNKSKEFKATIIKSIKTFRHLKDFRKSLDNMRKSYDFFIVNTLESYGVKIDGIYKELDKVWEKSYKNHNLGLLEKTIVESSKTNKKENKFKAAINVAKKLAVNSVVGNRIAKVKNFWEEYQNEVRDIIISYCERSLNNEKEQSYR